MCANARLCAPLLAWSSLYYRYVCVDLNVSVEELAECYGIEVRTIRRYVGVGARYLTRRLIELEQKARREQQRRRLLAALPYSVALPLVGRTHLLDELEHLPLTLYPCHILVTGMSGVGKTSFVQELLRRFIERDQLDQLVWLDEPKSIQFVRERLAEVFLREGGAVSLREYLLMYRVAVVIDGFSALIRQADALDALLHDLGAAVVVLINSVKVAVELFALHLPLPDIDPNDAVDLLAATLRLNPIIELEPRDFERLTHDLAAQVGGNPLALKLAAGFWDYTNWDTLHTDVQSGLLNRLFDALDPGQQQIWAALALFSRPAQIVELESLWGCGSHCRRLPAP